MTTKIEVYNFALMNLGERKLASITESRHPRFVFDDLWTTVTGYCLAQAMWKFAMRGNTVTLVQTAGTFGYTYAYAKPADMILPLCISETIGSEQLYNDVADIGSFWYANVATLFVRYTSNDAAIGMNPAIWTEGFTAYVAAALARRACLMVTSSKWLYDRLLQMEGEYYLAAASTDAVSLTVGMKTFNAEAHNRLAVNPEMQGVHLMPFAARAIAATRLNLNRERDGAAQE